jgi:hypothetical protein
MSNERDGTGHHFAVNVSGSKDIFLHSNIIFSPDGKEVYRQQKVGYGELLGVSAESLSQNKSKIVIKYSKRTAFFTACVLGVVISLGAIDQSPEGLTKINLLAD